MLKALYEQIEIVDVPTKSITVSIIFCFCEKVTQAVKDGVNVLIWSFISFEVDSETGYEASNDKSIRIKVSQNIENYKKYKQTLAKSGFDLVHLVAFGGWK